MKCNITLLVLTLGGSFCSYAAASQGFGNIAETLLPQIWMGQYFITLILGFLTISFFAYAYNLWHMHQTNPLFIPLTRVIMAFLFALLCLGLTLMDRPGQTATVTSIPIVKMKKIEKKSEQPGARKKHWANNKSIQNDN